MYSKVISMSLLLVFLLISGHDSLGQSRRQVKTIVKHLEDMIFIPKARQPYYETGDIIFTPADSHLVILNPSFSNKSDSVSAFYLSDHEVTNDEYRKFVDWVKDSLSKVGKQPESGSPVYYNYRNQQGIALQVNVMPDTTAWLRDSKPIMGDPMMQYYYTHTAFGHYPVVGVSAIQAEAYIHWLNKEFKKLLVANEIYIDSCGGFRLPKASEWQWAARVSQDHKNTLDENWIQFKRYPWAGHSLTYEKGYKANFGQIIDENHVRIKGFYDDQFMYTSPIKAYPPNEAGLFDMAGNASEWTSSGVSLEEVIMLYKKSYKNLLGDKYAFLLEEFLKDKPDWKLFEEHSEETYNDEEDRYTYRMAYIIRMGKDIKYQELQTKKVLQEMKSARIVKGGSWFHSPVYLQNITSECYDEEASHSLIGFRVAFTMCSELEKIIGEALLEEATEEVKYNYKKTMKRINRK